MRRPPAIRLAGGRVIDPSNGVDDVLDLVLAGGRVAAVGDGVATNGRVDKTIDVRGLWVIPGLVDLHVHLAEGPNARLGHAMLARAGVTMALDLGGPVAGLLEHAAPHGAGLTVAGVELLGRGDRGGLSPGRAEIRRAVERARASGGIGLKLHVDTPLSPEATELAIGVADETDSWLAIHCGTTETRSDLTGLREAVALADGRPIHIAHVNSYCRGALAEPGAEADEALAILRANPRAFAEAYLSPWNGNWGGCRDGIPEVARVGTWLANAGYPPTEAGLEAAIRAGAAATAVADREDVEYAVGERAVEAWRAAETRIDIGFPINPFDSRVRLATARSGDGVGFLVPAIATDGGSIPRNVTIAAGLALVELGGLTEVEFVAKASLAGALALGLPAKGQLGRGADADVAVVDPVGRRVVMTIAGGDVVMRDGAVLGQGTRVLCPPEGAAAVESTGCEAVPYDPATSGLRTGRFRPDFRAASGVATPLRG